MHYLSSVSYMYNACFLQEGVYAMNKNPRGLAVLVNINKVDPREDLESLQERSGSDIDVRMLENVFSQLYFEVCKHEDPTAAVWHVSPTCTYMYI